MNGSPISPEEAISRLNSALKAGGKPPLVAHRITRDAWVSHCEAHHIPWLSIAYPVDWVLTGMEPLAEEALPSEWREAPAEFRAHEHNRRVLQAFIQVLREHRNEECFVVHDGDGEQRAWRVPLGDWDAFIEQCAPGLNFVADVLVFPASWGVCLTLFHHERIEFAAWSFPPSWALVAMRSLPSVSSPRALEPRFSHEGFVQTSDRDRLCRELEEVLTARIRSASFPDEEGYRLIRELRALGHDLWSFDESTELQVWCGNWANPTRPYELIVEVSYRDEEEPRTVSVSFRARTPHPALH